MEKPILYSVVLQDEDCSYYDDEFLMTHSVNTIKQELEKYFQSPITFSIYPKVNVFEYDPTKERYVFKNKRSVFFNTWEIANVDEILESVSKFKSNGKNVETHIAVETDDFFLGKISVDIPVEIGNPENCPISEGVGVYYKGKFVWNLCDGEISFQLNNNLMTIPFNLDEGHQRYCLLFVVKEFIKQKYDEFFKK